MNKIIYEEIMNLSCIKLKYFSEKSLPEFIFKQNIKWLDISTFLPVFNILNLLRINYFFDSNIWIYYNNKKYKLQSVNNKNAIDELIKLSTNYIFKLTDNNNDDIVFNLKSPIISTTSEKNFCLSSKNNVYLKIINLSEFKKIDINCENLYLDLRNNMGGRISDLCNITKSFAIKKSCLCELNNGKDYYEIETEALNDIRFKKLIILINENTASSAEIMVNWLADNFDTQIIGRKSYGKWVSTSIKKYNNYYVKIPRYLVTYKNKFLFNGITPNIVMEDSIIEELLLSKGFVL